MSDGEVSDRDLFGGPLQLPKERRGRPEHVRTRETSNRVNLLFALDRTPKEVALALGVSVPTLRKHYFVELENRAAAHLMFEGVQLERLNRLAEEGNVAAEKELMKALERGRVRTRGDQMVGRQAKAAKVGKKEAAAVAAKESKGRFATRQPPNLLNPAGSA